MRASGASGPRGPIASTRPLVGRTPEMAALDRAAATAFAGEPTVVRLEGDAGLGKTALLRELVARLERDWVILRATGAEVERDLDLGVVEQLALAVERVDPRRDPPSSGLRGPDRPASWEAGGRLLDQLRRLAAERPVAVVIDDAHWADVVSLEAVAFAFRRLGGHRVLVVMANRPVAGDVEPLDRLRQDGGGELVRLRPMGEVALGELVTTTFESNLSPGAVARLHEHTRGSPLDALAVVAELGVEEVASGLGPLPAPRSFELLALSRLATCDLEVEKVVAATAVYGHALTLDQLDRMLTDEVDGDLLSLVGDAVDNGLLVVSGTGGRTHVDVAHPLVRSAVVGDLSPGRRATLHRRSAVVTSDPVRAMTHRLHGAMGDDEELGQEAEALAEQRIAAGWDLQGAGLLAAATEVVGDAARRAELLLRGAARLAAIGDGEAALALLGRVPVGEGGARRDLVEGQLALLSGDTRTARSRLEEAWEAGPPTDVAGLVAGLLATIDANQGRFSQALEHAQAALEQGDGGHDVGHPLVMLVSGAALEGDLEGGRSTLERWADRAAGPAARSDAMLAGAMLDLWSGNVAGVVVALTPMLTSGTRIPLLTLTSARYTLADAHYRAGEWSRALELAEELVAMLSAAGQDLVRPMAHSVAAFVHAARGSFDAARAHLAEGHAASRHSGNPNDLLWLTVAEGRLATAAGDAGAVVATLGLLDEVLSTFRLPEEVQPWRSDLVEALVAVGDLDRADRVLGDLEAATRPGGAASLLGLARAAGLVAAARGHHEAAASHFGTGLREAAEHPAPPFELARLELAAGLRVQAAERFEALGARPFAERASRHQRVDPPKAPELTRSERAVVELVADGLSNKEVAAELFVSVKTVESHLGRAFTKLGVRSRTELAVWWNRSDPLDGSG